MGYPAYLPIALLILPMAPLVMFFNVPPVALVIFFSELPALLALPCAFTALTVYKVTVTIAANNTTAVIANSIGLSIKSYTKETNIKVFYMNIEFLTRYC